jgi:ABC-type uncharacterized transport system auxiliary subunit
MNKSALSAIALAAGVLAGCQTTNSIPYKASTTNIITIQQTLQAQNKKVSVAGVAMAPGVEESPTCRLFGPIKVAPGKSPTEYIRDAMQEELFAAGVYQPNSPNAISGRIEALSFSSVTPANWTISMSVKTPSSPGYTVTTKYNFDTSWTADAACKNVADAFGPAVQDLLKQVVTNPQFASLAN